MHRRTLLLAASGSALTAVDSFAQAAEWSPSRPIRMIVPFVPGGSTDIAARILAEAMGPLLGQSVLVENRGGSGGNIGGEVVARAAPDGHTLLMGTTGLLTTNQHIYRQMSFDPLKDLAAVSMAYTSDLIIVITPSLPVRTLAEFVAYAKARPGQITFGSSGHGASTHTSTELFKLAAGVDLLHVPYRGSGTAMNDLISGTIQVMFTQVAGAVAQSIDGQVRALAVTGPRRHPLLPEIPSIAEAGYPAAEVTSWGAVMAPALTPASAIARLQEAIRKSIETPLVKARLEASGVDGVASTPEELVEFLRRETMKWSRVVREARIVVD